MALRDQPYFPLYVQDYLTDEKLNCCSAASQGVYIKIMCVLHKQENYGQILFKQKDKQKSSMIENFAYKFAKQLPFDYETILPALAELVEEGVLQIEGDILSQKRMVKDFKTSQLRSEAEKKGGGNPNLFKQNSKLPFKQKPKQNTENENENENESVNSNNKGVQGEMKIAAASSKPTIKQVVDYMTAQYPEIPISKVSDIAQYYYDYYTSNGWKVGKNKMKDWKASVRNWIKRMNEFQKDGNTNNTNATNSAPKQERVGRMAKRDLEEYLNRPIPIISIGGSGL